MTPEQRRALLGDDLIANIHAEVAKAPPPSPEVLARLRPILASAGRRALGPSIGELDEEGTFSVDF
jgi:hypothetical protein